MCRWGEENVPVYWAKAREVLGPYVAVAMDAAAALALQVVAGFKLVVQYCTDKKPALEQWVSVSLTRCYRFYEISRKATLTVGFRMLTKILCSMYLYETLRYKF